MSDSRRTDTRRIFSWLIAAFLTSASLGACSPPKAIPNSGSNSIETSSAPTVPAPPVLENAPTIPEPLLPSDETDSIGLLDGLDNLDLTKLLGSVLPNELVFIGGLEKNTFRSALFDLVQYMRNNTENRSPADVEAVIPKYRRVEMFGTWVNENAPQDCYNTRAEVLLRDLSGTAKPTFKPGNPCNVSKGQWHDPYSGDTFKIASAVQVDHVVPLKNAYITGAHNWSRERRCHFANYLDDSQHLLTVSGHENMSKSDSTPEHYLPSNAAYVCEYLTNWMRIKASWNLQFHASESLSIEKELRDRGCALAKTRPKLSEIQKNRAQSMRMNAKCLFPQ